VPNGNLRVHGWRDSSRCNLTGAPDPCIAVTPAAFPPAAGPGAKIRVETDFNWDGSFLLGALGLDVPIRTFHEDVYLGD
jgi:hypothetical protein